MNRVCAVVLLLLGLSGHAFGQESCRAIQDPKARLECFDKSTPTSQPEKPKAKKEPAKAKDNSSSWRLRRDKDSMTDAISCVVIDSSRPYLQVNIGKFFVSYRGRGGVDGYTYRIDNEPASQMQLPGPIDRRIGAIRFEGAVFNRIMSASRLRVQTITVLGNIVNDDIDLAPIKPLYARMKRECAE